jgi:hypothetical protein
MMLIDSLKLPDLVKLGAHCKYFSKNNQECSCTCRISDLLSNLDIRDEERTTLIVARSYLTLSIISETEAPRRFKDAEKDVLAALTDVSKCYGNHAPELLKHLSLAKVLFGPRQLSLTS